MVENRLNADVHFEGAAYGEAQSVFATMYAGDLRIELWLILPVGGISNFTDLLIVLLP